jgi:hypothetical protein
LNGPWVREKSRLAFLRLYLIFSRSNSGRMSEMKQSSLYFLPFGRSSAINNLLLAKKIVNIAFFAPIPGRVRGVTSSGDFANQADDSSTGCPVTGFASSA